MPPRAAGSDSYTQRMRSAAVRASGGHAELRRLTARLAEELEDVTPVHGVPITGLDEEDSMVTAISSMIAAANTR